MFGFAATTAGSARAPKKLRDIHSMILKATVSLGYGKVGNSSFILSIKSTRPRNHVSGALRVTSSCSPSCTIRGHNYCIVMTVQNLWLSAFRASRKAPMLILATIFKRRQT